jgi:hypothetical protein
MIDSTEPYAGEITTRVDGASESVATISNGGRRLPFVLRVATTWTHISDLPAAGDGEMRYFPRAPLTGEVAATSGGRDVHFSDLEV